MEQSDARKRPFWNYFFTSKLVAVCMLHVYLFVGALFYKCYNGLSWPQAYYLTISNGLRIGFDTYLVEKSRNVKIFSIIFKLIGVGILALLYTNMFRSNYFRTVEVRRTRIKVALTVNAIFVLFGGVLSYFMIEQWTIINSFYLVFSAYWWWGTYSLPEGASDTVLIITSTLTIWGGLSAFVLYGLISSEVEVLMEKYLLTTMAKLPFTSEELGIVQNLLVNKRSCRVEIENDESDDRRMFPVGAGTYQSIDTTNGAANEASHIDAPLDDHMVKHILLGRVLAMEDISVVYWYVRVNLTVALVALVLFGTLFYRYYDGSEHWSTSLNYSLSSVYRLGYSTLDVDGFSQVVSTLLMLSGWLCFGVLNISIVREFSLKTADIRHFYTILDGALCFALAMVTTFLFADHHHNPVVDGAVLVVDIMVGLGGSIPNTAVAWNYWLVNVYTAAAVPLFLAFVSHAEAEIDIGDYAGYMDNAVRQYFSGADLQLLAIFDRTHNRTSAFGIYELHALLILRFREVRSMQELVDRVNGEYRAAVASGMEPNTDTLRARSALLTDAAGADGEISCVSVEREPERKATESDSLLPKGAYSML